MSKLERDRDQYCFGLYSLECADSDGNKLFAPPFIGRDDESAIMALLEMSRTHPEIQKRYLYRIGTFCALDGVIETNEPRIVVIRGEEFQ